MEDDYEDLEVANIIYILNDSMLLYKQIKLSNLELLATHMACRETGKDFADIVLSPQYDIFIEDINIKYGNILKRNELGKLTIPRNIF